MSTETDKLFKFLSLMCVRLIGVGGADIVARRKAGELIIDLPFTPTAVYAPTTILHDLEVVDFSVVLQVVVLMKEKPSVRLSIQPKLRSWVWRAYSKDKDERSIGDLVEFFEVNVLEGGKEARKID